ncbi:cytochrome c1, partial [Acinetobacter baumannii]
ILANSGKAVASVAVTLVAAGALLLGSLGDARASEGTDKPPGNKWSFAGPFGKFDRGALQRGLKVYKEVCSNCHSLNYIAVRNLADPGGP